jgi:hypothetical protein
MELLFLLLFLILCSLLVDNAIQIQRERRQRFDEPCKQAMRFRLRIDEHNPEHASFTVFANGANCGSLTMRVAEYTAFAAMLRKGYPGIATSMGTSTLPKRPT